MAQADEMGEVGVWDEAHGQRLKQDLTISNLSS
jgi:hypothetical protein